MELNEPYLPSEPDVIAGTPVEYEPPPHLVDYWDWSNLRDSSDAVHTGRVAQFLREAARTVDPGEILERAVVARFAPTTGDPAAESFALADLAVTGRGAYERFSRTPPMDEALLSRMRNELPRVDAGLLRATVRQVLDRAYTVAWALRGSPSQRSALRPHLGWIAVSGEDDSPHAPTNVPSSQDWMGEILLGTGAAIPTMTLRATLMLPERPAQDPMPDLSMRILPDAHTFQRHLNDRSGAGYEELFLFIHGLGSTAEESSQFKHALIEKGLEAGRRFAVLSVDMPGMGYSSRLDPDALIRARVEGHHGFQLPDGAGSNFPLLGLYRDVLSELCRYIPYGVQYVMGGSLGGNMTLWLAARPMFSLFAPERATASSVQKFLCWSPASIWESYERSRDTPFEGNGTHMDIGKNGAKKRPLARMHERETSESRREFFELMQRGEELLGAHTVGAWGYPPTQSNLLLQSELYSERYRRVFWMASYEQVTFSHQERLGRDGQWPYRTIERPLLLAAGACDTGSWGVMDIYNPVKHVTESSPAVVGRRLLMQDTGHSISDERPRHLAERILEFIPDRLRPPLAVDLTVSTEAAAVGTSGGEFEASGCPNGTYRYTLTQQRPSVRVFANSRFGAPPLRLRWELIGQTSRTISTSGRVVVRIHRTIPDPPPGVTEDMDILLHVEVAGDGLILAPQPEHGNFSLLVRCVVTDADGTEVRDEARLWIVTRNLEFEAAWIEALKSCLTLSQKFRQWNHLWRFSTGPTTVRDALALGRLMRGTATPKAIHNLAMTLAVGQGTAQGAVVSQGSGADEKNPSPAVLAEALRLGFESSDIADRLQKVEAVTGATPIGGDELVRRLRRTVRR